MKKYENFFQALSNMKEIYNYEEPYDTVVLTGLVGLYELGAPLCLWLAGSDSVYDAYCGNRGSAGSGRAGESSSCYAGAV